MKLLKAAALALPFLIPTLAFAASGDFIPLVSIPNVDYGSASLTDYINSIFGIVISVAAMLAVIRIITGGFKYMTTEAVGAKGDARETIQGAVFGLILLLGSWLVLYTINPQILDLSALQFTSLKCEKSEGVTCGEEIQKAREEAEKRAKELLDEKNFKEYENDTGERRRGTAVRSDTMSGAERSAYIRLCRSNPANKVEEHSRTVCENRETKEEYSAKIIPFGSFNEFVCSYHDHVQDEELRVETYLECYQTVE